MLLAIFAGSGHALTTRRVTINGNETAIETTYTIAALSDRGTRVKGKRQEILCDFSPPPQTPNYILCIYFFCTRGSHACFFPALCVSHALRACVTVAGFWFFNKTMAPTFEEYLNDYFKEQFDGLVKFRTYPVRFRDFLDEGLDGNYDFAFTNPALFTCAEAELRMSALLTLRRNDLGWCDAQTGAC